MKSMNLVPCFLYSQMNKAVFDLNVRLESGLDVIVVPEFQFFFFFVEFSGVTLRLFLGVKAYESHDTVKTLVSLTRVM